MSSVFDLHCFDSESSKCPIYIGIQLHYCVIIIADMPDPVGQLPLVG